jgi:hypothetical protein
LKLIAAARIARNHDWRQFGWDRVRERNLLREEQQEHAEKSETRVPHRSTASSELE